MISNEKKYSNNTLPSIKDTLKRLFSSVFGGDINVNSQEGSQAQPSKSDSEVNNGSDKSLSSDEQWLRIYETRNNLAFMKNPSEELRLEAMMDEGAIQFLDKPSEAVQLIAVCHYGNAIQYMDSPSEAVQIQAVRSWGLAIAHISNPSIWVQIEAVSNHKDALSLIVAPEDSVKIAAVSAYPSAIKCIEDPSEGLKRLAVNKHSDAICYIKNPSRELLEDALNANGEFMRLISDPPEVLLTEANRLFKQCMEDNTVHGEVSLVNRLEAVHWFAVRENEKVFENLDSPSEAVQSNAVWNCPSVFQGIVNPSDEVIRTAVAADPSNVVYCRDMSEELKLSLVKNDPSTIQYIKNPSEELQLQAVSNKFYPHGLEYIKYPSEQVVIRAIEIDPQNIARIENPSHKLMALAIASSPFSVNLLKSPSEELIAQAIIGNSRVANSFYTDEELDVRLIQAGYLNVKNETLCALPDTIGLICSMYDPTSGSGDYKDQLLEVNISEEQKIFLLENEKLSLTYDENGRDLSESYFEINQAGFILFNYRESVYPLGEEVNKYRSKSDLIHRSNCSYPAVASKLNKGHQGNFAPTAHGETATQKSTFLNRIKDIDDKLENNETISRLKL